MELSIQLSNRIKAPQLPDSAESILEILSCDLAAFSFFLLALDYGDILYRHYNPKTLSDSFLCMCMFNFLVFCLELCNSSIWCDTIAHTHTSIKASSDRFHTS